MSIFKNIRTRFYVDLPMYEMGNLPYATKMDLAGRLLKYDASIGGTILAFKDVKPVDKLCSCYAESPYLHLKMEATFLVFKPVKGAKVPGRVTYSSSSSVSVTVFDSFSCLVDIDHLREGWEYNDNTWKRDDETFGENDSVLCEIIDGCAAVDGMGLTVKIVGLSSLPASPTASKFENEEQKDEE